MARVSALGVGVVLALALLAACAPDSTDERVTCSLAGVPVRAYVADDDAERARGLQGYESLAEGEAMLFVFDEAAPRVFAMKSVSFPIDVVFIAEDLTVSAIEPLDPGDTQLVISPGPSAYVIELPQGWAEDSGVTVGDAFAPPEDH